MSDRPQYPSYPGDEGQPPAAGQQPGQSPPEQQPPAYGQVPPPGYGQTPPAYGQAPPPGYGQVPPGYGQPPQPGFGHVPPGYGQPPAPYVPSSTKAVFSLVLGIVSILFCYLGALLGPAAIILSVLAGREIDERPGALAGKGMATAGLVTGIIGTVIWGLVGVLTIIGLSVE